MRARLAIKRSDLARRSRAQQGYITGTEARRILLQTGLPIGDLKDIWSLADPVSSSPL